MCGIVGLYTKTSALENQLGLLLSEMLVQMSDRGPDSAGVALYRNTVEDNGSKLTVLDARTGNGFTGRWNALEKDLQEAFGNEATVEERSNHAVVVVPVDNNAAQSWLNEHYPDLAITSSGSTIEIFKEKGNPADVIDKFGLRNVTGTHALGHTRMATESAVTTEHSHPFSTGLDLCLVHNGSLSNHNRLRENLRKQGIEFQTDNDSEVAAGYLMWRLREGDDLNTALENAIEDLDGFYTFAVGTKGGFAVLRDPIACKPAVLAETDDWVAMASEFCAIAQLPGAEDADIWEPEPARIYSWER